MDKVLLIADDLTGALDSSVAFAKRGISTCVGQEDYFLHSMDAKNCSVQVTVVPSRHMSPRDAFKSVYDVVAKSRHCGFTCIFKKTDSALRGNVGAELAAAQLASGEKTVYFVPAFPEMNRVTRGGVQYINGSTPVAESIFGKDPFNPVRHSSVIDIIRESTNIPAYLAGDAFCDGIAVFDAETKKDMTIVAKDIFGKHHAKLIAGCAGLANALPQVLQLEKLQMKAEKFPEKLLVFCGSINPISLAQCDAAEAEGAPRFHLIHNGTFVEKSHLATQIAEAAGKNPITVLDTGSTHVDTRTMDAAASGRLIAGKMSEVIRSVNEQVEDAVLFIIGGDTLIALIQSLGIETIIPVKELFPGVVLAKYHVQGQWRYLISKSGGFGDQDLLKNISLKLSLQKAMEESGGA